ncbi:MAG: OmpA family protein [Deltaproteobacteria bacterium]|nr:OmpA family protein [Deltaproteobacteria bacterium]
MEESNAGSERPIIIKKIKKASHGGHHGGAWKVAYADFITAMMALFLVLWLVAVLSIESRKAIAEYFRSYTIFKGTEAGGGKGMSIMAGNPVQINLSSEDTDFQGKEKPSAKLALELGKVIDGSLYELKDHVLIFTTDEGVRIEIVDQGNDTMFELGKTNLLNNGQKVLGVLADALKDVPYKIAIEGHTDSNKYQQENYSNWELAADRANAARRELVRHGLDAARITKVTSFADVVLLNPGNPLDSTNRRVSILIETKKDGFNDEIEFQAVTVPAKDPAAK